MKKKQKMTQSQDDTYDRKHGIKEGSKKDMLEDRKHGIKDKKKKQAKKGKMPVMPMMQGKQMMMKKKAKKQGDTDRSPATLRKKAWLKRVGVKK